MSGGPVRKPAAEPFARLPWRITDALRRGDLTPDKFVLLVYLVARIYREMPQGGVLVTALAVMKAETNWPKSSERLRQLLEELEQEGWIGTRRSVGSSKWEVWLTGAAAVEAGGQTPKTGPPDLEVTSEGLEVDASVDPAGETGGAAAVPPNVSGSKEEESEEEEGFVYEGGEGSRAVAANDMTGATLAPDVLEAVNRARVARGEQPLTGRDEPKLLRPLIGEPGYYQLSRAAFKAGHITFAEHLANTRMHRIVRDALEPPMGEQAFLAAFASAFDATPLEPDDPEDPA